MTSLAPTACLRRTLPQMQPVWLSVMMGLACALAVGKALPVTKDAISGVLAPMCATAAAAGSPLDKVEPVDSYPLPNVPGADEVRNFSWNGKERVYSNAYNVRIDHRIGSRDFIFGRISENNGNNQVPTVLPEPANQQGYVNLTGRQWMFRA